MVCIVAVTLCGTALAAGRSNGTWVRNTWTEGPRGLIHAYFVLPQKGRTSPSEFNLDFLTTGQIFKMGCKVRVRGQTWPATTYVNGENANDDYIALFKYRKFKSAARATATCVIHSHLISQVYVGGFHGSLGRQRLRRT
jgi:hypothetical protein